MNILEIPQAVRVGLIVTFRIDFSSLDQRRLTRGAIKRFAGLRSISGGSKTSINILSIPQLKAFWRAVKKFRGAEISICSGVGDQECLISFWNLMASLDGCQSRT